MNLSTLDWSIIFAFFIFSLIIGLVVAKRSGTSSSEFFLSGRNMPWWLLGVSMVATTFSADTPNFVTNVIRNDGVAGNWVWWAFLLTGMLTVFVYARLWRRSGVLTDLEFYELRYSGKPAAFLRGFRALYLGVFFNVLVMAAVCLAAIKIGGAMLQLEPWQTIVIASLVTVIYSALGGLRGVIITDFFQFIMAMVGAIWAAYVLLNHPEIQVEGLADLLNHPNLEGKLDLIPDINNTDLFITAMIIPLAVQWWSVWYPGAEPGGGGYIAQRMLAAKDEKNAMGATLFFNVAHYALRPWPWIIIALLSLVVFPMNLNQVNQRDGIVLNEDAKIFLDKNVNTIMIDSLSSGVLAHQAKAETKDNIEDFSRLGKIIKGNPNSYEVKSLAYIFSERNWKDKSKNIWKDKDTWSNPIEEEKLVYLQMANPNLPLGKLGHDLAYPTMLNFLPSGLLGLVLASLIAAFMSTISTHLNWGSSYVVNDFYKRFVKPAATEKELVSIGRISTVVLMVLAALFALLLSDAVQAFNILLQIGAGTGLLFILRWFWWRINAYSEIAAMVISFLVALYFEFLHGPLGFEAFETWEKLIAGVATTTFGWFVVTLMTSPTNQSTLASFYKLIKPAKGGWKPVIEQGIADRTIQQSDIKTGRLPLEILGMMVGCFTVYGTLFATGYWLYGASAKAWIATAIAIVGAFILFWIWGKVSTEEN